MTALSVLLFGLLVAVGFVCVWTLVTYNGLVAARQECDRAWFNIDVLLKQRHDELPQLVETCRGYMAFEQSTLERLVVARMTLGAARDLPTQTRASQAVSDALRQLFAVAERYPDLKANESFAKLSARISELENQIADRRELYNAATTILEHADRAAARPPVCEGGRDDPARALARFEGRAAGSARQRGAGLGFPSGFFGFGVGFTFGCGVAFCGVTPLGRACSTGGLSTAGC